MMTSLAEALFGPGTLFALAILIPLALRRVLEFVFRLTTGGASPADRRARFTLGVCVAALFLSAGRRALGPALVDAPHGVGSFAFGAFLACVAFVASTRGGARPAAPEAPSPLLGAMVGGALGVALLAGWGILLSTTRIDEAEVPTAGVDASRLRLQIDPWDETATLALAWAAREADELERAETLASAALEMGAPLDDVRELQIEVLAAAHRCEEANALFSRALEERARLAFDEEALLTERIELGGYRLPPTYVSTCGVEPPAE